MVPEHENSTAMTEDSITISPGGRVPSETTTPDAGDGVEREIGYYIGRQNPKADFWLAVRDKERRTSPRILTQDFFDMRL
jgi:hypothetical protein